MKATTSLAKAERKIEDCLYSKSRTLNLRQMEMSLIPDSFSNLIHLSVLIVEHNPAVSSIPASVGSLRGLCEIRANNTGLMSLPDTFSQLQQLHTVVLSSSPGLDFPIVLCQCVSLQHVDLHDCAVTFIPSEMGNLTALEVLNLSQNHISSVPSELSKCVSLKTLELSKNEITVIPTCMSNLSVLEVLDISFNAIPSVPVELCDCTSLTSVNLSHNRDLTELPEGFARLVLLQTLRVNHCQISSIPDTFAFPSLTDLNVSANPLSSCDFLHTSSKLQTLSIARCTSIDALPFLNHLSRLQDLSALDVRGCQLSEYPLLSCFPSLRTVNLSENLFTEPPSLELIEDWRQVNGLERIDLSQCPIRSWPKYCAGFEPLRAFNCNFADEVIPGLFLGNVHASRHHAGLVGCGIKSVVNAATREEGGHFPDLFEYYFVNAKDTMEQSLLEQFEHVVEFITKSLTNGPVLVHCWAGRSRSATMVLAYLMATRRINLYEAYQIARAARPGIGPNGNFIEQLRRYEAKLGIEPSPHALNKRSAEYFQED